MSNELLNKAVSTCFAKIARVDGSIGKEETDIINSSDFLKKYSIGDIESIDTSNFFNKIQSDFGNVMKEKLDDNDKKEFIYELVSLIKADNKVHDHEFFLLGHIANSIGFNPTKVAEIINEKGLDSSKTTGWFSWLFG